MSVIDVHVFKDVSQAVVKHYHALECGGTCQYSETHC
jgi:hypothetical protein